ncbi:MAG: GNAT family N-acetyltransferase [Gammaproteobacteria bacterium]|nr:GNAT family N-acetyltransferase [Gammaproteobacteria bacterium]
MNYRRFTTQDREPVYQLFRESLWDFMTAGGLVEADDVNEVDASFERQRDFYQHLEQTAYEDWIAEDDRGVIVGWARSVERAGHLQLTHFFVAPSTQGQGVGRALLDRAFAPGGDGQRSVLATTNPSALSLYLRYGVSFRSLGFCMYGAPRNTSADLYPGIERAEAGRKTLEEISRIEARVLGYERPVDLEFLLQRQPVYLLRRQGRVTGYAFGSNDHDCGPAAALDPADLPLLLQAIEASALAAGRDELTLTVPAVAHHAVDWLLAGGYRIDPFYEVLLARQPTLQLDRYLLTECSFIW